MELFDDPSADAPSGNAPTLSVSELSGAIRRVVEGEFGRVRVRGEVGRVSRPSSGHLYFDLKDDRAVLAAVCWRDNACRLPHRPEEGLEVIATGRLTTFPGQSRYQLLVEQIEPAGLGALMAMLEQRRRALAAEGLFDAARKRPIPFLPGVIAVVTSPSGAVIRDILHRLRDRFPSRVLIWPVAVQGAQSAPQVAQAIAALNALPAEGAIARPDLIIVARGGGSVEDLWGFNEEAVVRAVAAGTIPLISAVGHETDTTLIDHAADLRAPTPTAAAEMAVPVLAELGARIADSQSRLWRSARARIERPAQRLADLGRLLGRPQAMTDPARQRLDLTGPRLEPVLRGFVRARRREAEALDLPLFALRSFMADRRTELGRAGSDLDRAARQHHARLRAELPMPRPAAVQLARAAAARRLAAADGRLAPALARRTETPARRLDELSARLPRALARRQDDPQRRLAALAQRLTAARARMQADARRLVAADRTGYAALERRLAVLATDLIAERRAALARLDRLRQTLGHTETLRRGFVIVHGPRGLVVSANAAARAAALTLEFNDGALPVTPSGPVRPGSGGGPAGGEGDDARNDGASTNTRSGAQAERLVTDPAPQPPSEPLSETAAKQPPRPRARRRPKGEDPDSDPQGSFF
ncbi:exodeoxyribonuclease VII large subunit [Paracoccus sanguinis]|uniref:exodeoxyribonuclease VII large subunit n=1 Tax=Paracoccus sanguinis TaxID=1545044 RepID=UPI0009DF07B9